MFRKRVLKSIVSSGKFGVPVLCVHKLKWMAVMCLCIGIISLVFLLPSPDASSISPSETAAQRLVTQVPTSAQELRTFSVYSADELSLAHVPHIDAARFPLVRKHDEDEFLVVVGIPTTDTSFGANRRQWQRESWHTYKGVRSHNPSRCNGDCDGTVLVKYLVGRHPSHNFEFSAELMQEALRSHGDIIPLRMKEGAPTTAKKDGGKGYWGLESEVGMSRKALMWYAIAASSMFRATYVMKCDDDVFLRVPQYLSDLNTLQDDSSHRRFGAGRMLYWGKVMKWGAVKGDPKSVFYFVGGMSITMSVELAKIVTEYLPIQEHIGEYVAGGDEASKKLLYKEHNMDHEDVMVGRIFYTLRTNVTMVKDCRFHDVHVGANVKAITDSSVVIHHLRAEEYGQLMLRFPDGKVQWTVFSKSSDKGYHTALTPC